MRTHDVDVGAHPCTVSGERRGDSTVPVQVPEFERERAPHASNSTVHSSGHVFDDGEVPRRKRKG